MRVITLREASFGLDGEDIVSSISAGVPVECSDVVMLCMISLGLE